MHMPFQTARSYTGLSIVAALVTLALTFGAFVLTDSLALLSAAAELLVNLVAALVAWWTLTLAARPANEDHAYGFTKAEYFSSGVEGTLIILAALGIVWTAVPHLLDPHPLEQIGWGLLVAVIAAAINGSVALILLRAGRRLRSITLEADGKHLLTDVWTTGGVLVGVALVWLIGWAMIDPMVALLVAANIIWTGVRLIRESGLGLLDTALPEVDRRAVVEVLERFKVQGIVFHALRTRRSGSRRFLSMHVLVPGSWTVKQGHDTCEAIERALHHLLPETTVFTHLEPREDPASWQDQELDRAPESAAIGCDAEE